VRPRHPLKLRFAGVLAALLSGAGAAPAVPAAVAPPNYHVAHELPLPGDDGWDYLAFEQGGKRLFIAHGNHVLVVDTETLTVAGDIADTPGVHGIALAPDLGRGYVSAGRANSIVVFDLKTLARLKEIKSTGDNPDAILYDAPSQRVLAFDGRGRNVTVVDARTDTVAASIALDGKPEFAVADGNGHVFVNLEDKSSIARLDPLRAAVSATWPLAGCQEPSGLAIDARHARLFSTCGNKVMAVVSADNGKALGSAAIGGGVDAAAYDPGTGLTFASCGEGVLTVVRPDHNGRPEVVQSLKTAPGARTLAVDLGTHRVFLVTANFGPPPPATAERPHPRGAQLPGTFRLLVVDP
jgi:DNA-binding beta-propeller fold protein YncE